MRLVARTASAHSTRPTVIRRPSSRRPHRPARGPGDAAARCGGDRIPVGRRCRLGDSDRFGVNCCGVIPVGRRCRLGDSDRFGENCCGVIPVGRRCRLGDSDRFGVNCCGVIPVGRRCRLGDSDRFGENCCGVIRRVCCQSALPHPTFSAPPYLGSPARRASPRGACAAGLADGRDAAVFDAEQAVGQRLGFVQVVRDVQRRHAGHAADVLQQGTHLLPGLVVQGAERFVQAQDARAERQGAAQGHALPLAAAQPARPAVQQVRRCPAGRPVRPPAAGSPAAGTRRMTRAKAICSSTVIVENSAPSCGT